PFNTQANRGRFAKGRDHVVPHQVAGRAGEDTGLGTMDDHLVRGLLRCKARLWCLAFDQNTLPVIASSMRRALLDCCRCMMAPVRGRVALTPAWLTTTTNTRSGLAQGRVAHGGGAIVVTRPSI